MSLHYDNRSLLRDYDAKDFKTSLHLCYKIIIAPVARLLKQPEIIIVPDSCVYQVPFAALADEGGKYLSETCRIRLVPSLTTLKLVQDSPPDYHSQTGALIVGDPGLKRWFTREGAEILNHYRVQERKHRWLEDFLA